MRYIIRGIFFVLLSTFFLSCTSENTTSNTSDNNKNIIKKGDRLFKKYCSECHAKTMRNILTAPALGFVLKKRTQDWLIEYIKSPNKMLESKDSIALQLRKEGWSRMPPFHFLSNEEINSILQYIENEFNKKK